jgi:hypothetical protein
MEPLAGDDPAEVAGYRLRLRLGSGRAVSRSEGPTVPCRLPQGVLAWADAGAAVLQHSPRGRGIA